MPIERKVGRVEMRVHGSWWQAHWICGDEKPLLLAQIRTNLVPGGSEGYHKFIEIIQGGVQLGFQEIGIDLANVKMNRVGGVFRQ